MYGIGTQELVIMAVLFLFIFLPVFLVIKLRKHYPNNLWISILLCLLNGGIGQFYLPGGLKYLIGLGVLFAILKSSMAGSVAFLITDVIAICLIWYRHSKIKQSQMTELGIKNLKSEKSPIPEPGVRLLRNEQNPMTEPGANYMSEMDKYYQILGLKPGDSEKEFLEAYKALVKVWDSTRFKDDPQIQRIATEKIKEIDDALKQLLVWAGGRHEKGREIPEPPLTIRPEPSVMKGGIVVQTEPAEAMVHINEKPGRADPTRKLEREQTVAPKDKINGTTQGRATHLMEVQPQIKSEAKILGICRKHEKKIYIISAIVMWGVNSLRTGGLVEGLGYSMVLIPVFSAIGVLFIYGIYAGLLFYNLLLPDNKRELSPWGNASAGLIVGIISRVFGWA